MSQARPETSPASPDTTRRTSITTTTLHSTPPGETHGRHQSLPRRGRLTQHQSLPRCGRPTQHQSLPRCGRLTQHQSLPRWGRDTERGFLPRPATRATATTKKAGKEKHLPRCPLLTRTTHLLRNTPYPQTPQNVTKCYKMLHIFGSPTPPAPPAPSAVSPTPTPLYSLAPTSQNVRKCQVKSDPPLSPHPPPILSTFYSLRVLCGDFPAPSATRPKSAAPTDRSNAPPTEAPHPFPATSSGARSSPLDDGTPYTNGTGVSPTPSPVSDEWALYTSGTGVLDTCSLVTAPVSVVGTDAR